jgi:hypothetical protein
MRKPWGALGISLWLCGTTGAFLSPFTPVTMSKGEGAGVEGSGFCLWVYAESARP